MIKAKYLEIPSFLKKNLNIPLKITKMAQLIE